MFLPATVCSLVSGVTAWVWIFCLLKLKSGRQILRPQHNHTHSVAIPRVGGAGIVMGLLAYLGMNQGFLFSSMLAFGMIGAILGFLLHNFPLAKCYMGDSGAYLIGFMIAALSVLNSQKGAIMAAMIDPVLALSLPILDVTFAFVVVLIALRGQSISTSSLMLLPVNRRVVTDIRKQEISIGQLTDEPTFEL